VATCKRLEGGVHINEARFSNNESKPWKRRSGLAAHPSDAEQPLLGSQPGRQWQQHGSAFCGWHLSLGVRGEEADIMCEADIPWGGMNLLAVMLGLRWPIYPLHACSMRRFCAFNPKMLLCKYTRIAIWLPLLQSQKEPKIV
jgi:hypothetical protein